jgi:hypothetical protein
METSMTEPEVRKVEEERRGKKRSEATRRKANIRGERRREEKIKGEGNSRGEKRGGEKRIEQIK